MAGFFEFGTRYQNPLPYHPSPTHPPLYLCINEGFSSILYSISLLPYYLHSYHRSILYLYLYSPIIRIISLRRPFLDNISLPSLL